MVRANLGLVVAIAGRFPCLSMPLEDLVAQGDLGLIRAVETFDPGKGARFSTSASCRIKQAIRRGLMNQSDVVRRPAHAHKLPAKWRRASAALAREVGREPTAEEVGANLALGLAPRQVRIALEARRRSGPAPGLGDPGEAGSSWEPLVIEGRGPDPAAAETLGRLRTLLEDLGGCAASVLRLRSGRGEGPMTLRGVGQRWGLSWEYVRLAQNRALRSLADAMGGG